MEMSRAIMLRELSHRVAAHPRIEQAVTQAIRAELPGVIECILSEMYPGENVQIYAPKKPVQMRRDRDLGIRTEYNGHNAQALARKYGVSVSMVFKIVRIK
jgi:Mor family transcriptional regulator